MENYYGGPKGLQGIQGKQGEDGFNFAIHNIIENSDINNLNEVLSFVPQLISTASYEENNWTVYYFSKLGISYCYAKDKNDEIHKIFLGYQHSGFWNDNLSYGEKIDISFKNFEDLEVYSFPSALIIKNEVSESEEPEIWDNPIDIDSDAKWIINFKLLNPSSFNEFNSLAVKATDTHYAAMYEDSISGKIEGQGAISSMVWFFSDSPIIISDFYFKNIDSNQTENLGTKLSNWKSEWKKEEGFYSLNMMEQSLKRLENDSQSLILKSVEEGIYNIKSNNFSSFVGQKDLKIGFLYTDNTKDLTLILDIDINFVSDVNKKVKAIILNSQKFDGYFKAGNIQIYKMFYRKENDLIKFSALEESSLENGNINFNFTEFNDLILDYTINNLNKKIKLLNKYNSNLLTSSNFKVDKKGDYCLNVFNKQIDGWTQINSLSNNNVYYYEKGDSPTREVTFSLACQDDYFKVNDYDPPFNVVETYTAVIGSELGNAATGSSILNDILGINENHNCYGFETTIDGVDTIFTLNGSTSIGVAWNDALGPSSIIEKSWNGVTFWVTRAQ